MNTLLRHDSKYMNRPGHLQEPTSCRTDLPMHPKTNVVVVSSSRMPSTSPLTESIEFFAISPRQTETGRNAEKNTFAHL